MNILYIEHYAGSPEMGMEFRPYYLSREWVKMGHKVTIIAGDYSHLRGKNPSVEHDFQEENIDGITYLWVKTGIYNGNGIQRAFTMFRFVFKIRKHARMLADKYSPDIIIASSTYPLDTYAAQKMRKLTGGKYIHEVHDMWPSTLYTIGGMSRYNPFVVLMQIAENSAYSKCDNLVALAPFSKEYMVKHGLAPQKFHNIQNGIVEEDWKSSAELPEEHKAFFESQREKFIVGYFGGHAISNSLDILLDSAKQTKDKDIIYVLVGEGVEKGRLEQRATDEKIDNVYFLPRINKKAIPALLKEYDCSIMIGIPSINYKDGLCLNKMYDSMMGGTPVICVFNTPACIVEENGCGILVKQVEPQAIVKAIQELKILPKNEIEKMGQNGVKTVLSKYTYRKLAEQFVEVMDEARNGSEGK